MTKQSMQFSGTLYPYQEEILKVFESERKKGEKKIHVVAPPGSGKTIIGLEMMCRLDVPTLILVPNLTLQEQWKDKLIKLFLNNNRVEGEELISTTIQEIKKINIITYQSLSSSGEDDDFIREEIYNTWYEAEKENFSSKDLFTSFIHELREENREEYEEQYSTYRKALRKSGVSFITRGMMKGTIKEYVEKLRTYGVNCMIVDEAHHLTSWWSHVLYEIWTDLDSPHIIGLTATPPFENSDYFDLDESYTKLLGTVDYYIPTPAIVKSGRLAPYSDLVYFVQPDENLAAILQEKEKRLQEFITIHKDEINTFLDLYIRENIDMLKIKSLSLIEKYMRFLYAYKGSGVDMSPYITKNASLPASLEDIAKSIGKWGMSTLKKSKSSKILDEIKSLFFDLGYIWRSGNLYRFETPIEKGLIYSKSKIHGIQALIEQEKKNLGNNLRCVIICDFLDSESDWINGHYIFDILSEKFPKENIHLVSGQGIWGMKEGKKQEIDTTILGVTEEFSQGNIQILIGTRGILGEGWDCPRVNTLIDVTGVSAYMSVNQIHGRAIRLDLTTPKKVANIYDIVCLGDGYQGLRDFERLSKKHNQFYGVDESGLILKELDHVYPQLERNLEKSEEINTYTLKKSELKDMVYELWCIGGDFRNEEIFSLSLNITKPYAFVPLPGSLSIKKFIKLRLGNWRAENLMNFGDSTYHELVRLWIRDIIDGAVRVLRYEGKIDDDFSYLLHHSKSGSITITAKTLNILKGKEFIEIISELFGPITDEKYKYSELYGPQLLDKIELPMGINNRSNYILYIILGAFFIIYTSPLILSISNNLFILFLWIFGGVISLTLWTNKILNMKRKWISIQKELEENTYNINLGLPAIIASNEWKRKILRGNMSKSFFHIQGYLENKKKISVVILMLFYGFLFMRGIHWFIPEIGFIIVGIIIDLFLSIISYHLLNNFLNFCLSIPRRIRYRNVKEMHGIIVPIEPSDVGTQKFISAKVEKLWI